MRVDPKSLCQDRRHGGRGGYDAGMRPTRTILLLALACATPAPAQDTTPPLAAAEITSQQIVFTSDRSGTEEIWAIGVDGTGATRLTDASRLGGMGDLDPSWSPGADLIAFNTYRFGGWKIGLMGPDGSQIRRLTNNDRSVYEGSAAWSPDGRRVAFMRYRSEQGIWICDADGGNARRVVDNGRDYYRHAQPSWSADGSRLLFVSSADGNYDIWSVRTDGTDRRRVTATGHDELAPTMSPDGARILFYSNRDGHYETYVMDADGSNPVRLTFSRGGASTLEEGPSGTDAFDPAWSPDGRFIALVEAHEGQRDIYVTRADGTGRLRVTRSAADDYFPSWAGSPLSGMPEGTSTPRG